MSKYTGQYPAVYKITDYGQKLGNEANRLAYPNNPKVAQYPSGHATPQFKSTMNAVFKGFKFWNAWSKVGASCDVFVSTCIRSVYDKTCPAGLWKILKYMESPHLRRDLRPDFQHLPESKLRLHPSATRLHTSLPSPTFRHERTARLVGKKSAKRCQNQRKRLCQRRLFFENQAR